MYLIYFYSAINDEIIPKVTVDNTEDIKKTILKTIYDIIVFEEGKRKAEQMIIFDDQEKILFEGLDDGIYVSITNNRYNIFKKKRKFVIKNGWFTTYKDAIYDNINLGYFSFLSIPGKTQESIISQPNLSNFIPIAPPPIVIKTIKNNDNKKVITNTNTFEDVIFELKNKFNMRNDLKI
jgi:hypothetical protein